MTVLSERWEKRARELFFGPSPTDIEAALRLGREMADARAEEIARMLHKEGLSPYGGGVHYPWWKASDIARSTIKKPEPLPPRSASFDHQWLCTLPVEHIGPCMNIQQPETPDERAEAIAKAIEEATQPRQHQCYFLPYEGVIFGQAAKDAAIARATIKKPEPPMTREKVLAAALRKIRAQTREGSDVDNTARRALDWKPD